MTFEQQITIAIRRIMRGVDLHSRRLAEEHGLTGPQLAVLQCAARLDGASIVSLARATHLSSPTVTGIVDRLARNGLVERTRSKEDRRSIRVTLTSRGEEVLAAAPSLLADRCRDELLRLEDWERSMILAGLQRVANLMDATGLEALPPTINQQELEAQVDLAAMDHAIGDGTKAALAKIGEPGQEEEQPEGRANTG